MSFSWETYLKQKEEGSIKLIKNEFGDGKIYAHFKRYNPSTGLPSPDIIQEVDILAISNTITKMEGPINSLKNLLEDCKSL